MGDMAEIEAKIVAQGDKIRELKSAKAAKDVIQPEVATLLALKAEYKAATGEEWKPSAAPPKSAPAKAASPPKKVEGPVLSGEAKELDAKVTAAGEKVRALKTAKAEKAEVDEAVKTLLALKAEFKAAAGFDWKPAGAEPKKEKGKGGKDEKEKIESCSQQDVELHVKQVWVVSASDPQLPLQIEDAGRRVT